MIRIGTAGWSLPLAAAEAFGGDGSHLARYARVLRCAEINSSFHRSHRQSIYARWAAQTPPDFRFSVKLPRTITHDQKLRDAEPLLAQLLSEVGGLGDRLGVLLVQLPPSLAFDAGLASDFFACLRGHHPGAVACEPRHASWFEPDADSMLADCRVARVAADPARVPAAELPGGWMGPGHGAGVASSAADGAAPALRPLVYYRWHGSPRIYRSAYEADWLRQRNAEIAALPMDVDCWCIFDNTAAGGAIANALELQAMGNEPRG